MNQQVKGLNIKMKSNHEGKRKSSEELTAPTDHKIKKSNSTDFKIPPIPIQATILTNETIEYPYQVDDDDHCETPIEAYQDIIPILDNLINHLGYNSREELKIYDPFYCEGQVITRLSSLGFTNVYNRKEDFYLIQQSNQIPIYDVLLTNPPYSSDHMEKLLTMCVNSNKPWLLLLPNYVYTKDYYNKISQNSNKSKQIFYITPANNKRYLYTTPKGRRQQKSSKYTAPFPTLWLKDTLYQTYKPKGSNISSLLAKTTWDIPIE
eukprot:gene5923-8170_t